MLRLVRILCVVPLLAAVLVLRAEDAAASAAPVPSGSPLPPELQAELDALQRAAWHPSASARARANTRSRSKPASS